MLFAVSALALAARGESKIEASGERSEWELHTLCVITPLLFSVYLALKLCKNCVWALFLAIILM